MPAVLSRRAFLVASLAQAAACLTGCTIARAPLPSQPPAPGLVRAPTATQMPTPLATGQLAQTAPTGAVQTANGALCALPPVVVPTPLPYPGYTAQEPETGLHVTGPAHQVDFTAYRLRVYGKVDHPVDLTYDQVRCLPKVSAACVLECPGYFIDNTNLAGATIASIIGPASPARDATSVRLLSADGYAMPFALEEAQDPKNFLAYEWEGQPLPASHGFPLRAAMPGRPGSSWVKWVVGIEVT